MHGAPDSPRAEGGILEAGRGFWTALLAVAAASVVLRIPLLDVPMINDEGGYAYVARFWSPDYQLYRDIPFYRPQAIFYLYRAILATLGDDVVAFRLFAGIWNAATVVCVGLLGRAAYTSRAGLAAAGVFAVFSAGPSMEGFTANAEIFAQLPIVVSALMAWHRKWLWAGLAAAAAVLLKPSGVSAYLLAVGWAFATGASIPGALRVSVPFGLGLLPSVLHGAWIGWEHYWENLATHRTQYADAESLALGTQWARLSSAVGRTVASWGVPGALALVGLARRWGRPELFAMLWIGTSAVGMAMGGFWFEHYFIQLMPPLALLAGAGLRSWPRDRSGLLLSVPVVLALGAFSKDVRLWVADPVEVSWALYAKPGYTVQREVVEHLESATSEDDRIFVAFSQAEIYYLARRKASWPYMWLADFEYSQEIFDGAVASIREREPALVVVFQPPPAHRMSMNDFLGLLSEGYDLVHTVRSGPSNSIAARIYRRK